MCNIMCVTDSDIITKETQHGRNVQRPAGRGWTSRRAAHQERQLLSSPLSVARRRWRQDLGLFKQENQSHSTRKTFAVSKTPLGCALRARCCWGSLLGFGTTESGCGACNRLCQPGCRQGQTKACFVCGFNRQTRRAEQDADQTRRPPSAGGHQQQQQ